MGCRQKLLLSFMVGGLMLFYGIAVAAALTPPEIAKIAEDSTVLLDIRDAYGKRWRGSGFFVGPNQIATNYHVIENMSIGYAKLVEKEKWYGIKVFTVDKDRDLAVVKVTGIDVPALPLGDSDAVQKGDKVYVMGNPQGLEGTLTEGLISAIRPEGIPLVRGKTLQMDASISKGSSGGPVLNSSGEVIGIAVAGEGFVKPDGHVPQNLNFAIAVNYLKPLVTMPISSRPVKPKPVKPKVEPPLVEPKPAKPQVDPLPVQPKPVKPQPPAEPKPVQPQVNPPPVEPKPQPRLDTLEKGVKLYEQARYNEAIKALSSVVRELEDPEQQAQAYLYLGCSKRGFGEGNDKVREQFQESIRHNPNQKLPPRVGKDHPIFAELLEEVRKELTGELTVISLLPQTEIWIFGTGTDRKMLGTGIVSSRLLKGNYIVEGIYAGESRRKTVAIEPDRHEVLDLEIPPIVEHDSPSRISVGERIPLTLNLISSKAPQQVKIYYTIYDRDSNELAQQNQEMRLWDKESTSSTWIYKLGLPAQKYGGLIKYHIEVEYENHLTFRQPETQYSHYQISIVDDKPPTISLLDPPEGAKFGANQQITIRAEVTDNIAVKDVHIHSSSFNSQQSQKLVAEGPSDIYTIDITVRNIVVLRYYLTATDEEGNESRSESRHLEIKPGEKPQKDPNTVPTIPVGPPKPPPRKPDPPMTSTAPASPVYQGIWASVSAHDASTFAMFRLAYVREGKNQSTLGAQLDFSHPDRTNVSAMVQWGPPALGKSNIAFTLLGGIAEYENFLATGTAARSTHMTPILGAGLKFYPRDKIVIDATSSIKFRSDYDTTGLYHYEIGARFYITREVNLRIGYGKLYLGNRNFTTIQVGLGYTF